MSVPSAPLTVRASGQGRSMSAAATVWKDPNGPGRYHNDLAVRGRSDARIKMGYKRCAVILEDFLDLDRRRGEGVGWGQSSS